MNNILKNLTVLLFVLIALQSKAQEKFSSYDNTYLGKTFEIQIAAKDITDYSLYIDAMSLDDLISTAGITIKQNQQQEFTVALSDAKVKYEEWVKTAKENNVKALDKSMSITSKAGGYFLFGGEWEFQFLVNLKFDFKILESKGETKYLLLVKTGELQSSGNQFIKADGCVLVFSSSKEIDDFKAAISSEKIEEFVKKPKKEDLFKD